MIAAIVVPLGCRSIPITVSSLGEARVNLADIAFGLAALDAAGDRAALRFRLKDGVARDCLVIRFADFDLVLLVAIWVSLMSTTASNAATDTSPALRRGHEENRAPSPAIPVQQQGRIMQTTGLVLFGDGQ
jgi:hypothetical protein